MDKLMLSIPDVSEVTGLGRTSIYALIRDKKLPSVKVGRRTLIVWEDLEEFIAKLRSEQNGRG